MKKEQIPIRNLACEIVDTLEEFLMDRGIKIPCADQEEQKERIETNGNDDGIYGSEYWDLVDKVFLILESKRKGK